MSDEQLRDLERVFRATGALDDERRLLLERLRVGALAQSRLELAAYVGHEAARVVLGAGAPQVPAELAAWIEGLARWEFEVVGRAGLAVARAVLARSDPGSPAVASLVAFADAIGVWLEAPTETDRRAAAARVPGEAVLAGVRSGEQLETFSAVDGCIGGLLRWSDPEARGREARAAATLAVGAAQAATNVVGEAGVRAAVRDAIGAWALAS